MRRRKGWIGFVQGYKDWVKACDEGAWDNIEWSKIHSAKEVEKTDMKTIYKY